MSEHGLRCWDANGALIFSGDNQSMRVICTIPVRLGAGIRSAQNVYHPLIRAGMIAFVQPLPEAYPTGWGSYTGYKVGHRGSVPTVRVYDGFVQAFPPPRSGFYGNFDLVVVAP